MLEMNLIYKRGLDFMNNGSNKKEERRNAEQTAKCSSDSKQTLWKKILEHPLTAVVVAAALAGIGSFGVTLFNMNANLREVTVSLNEFRTQTSTEVSEVKEDLKELDTEINQVKEDYAVINAEVRDLSGDFSEVFEVSLKQDAVISISKNFVKNEYHAAAPAWDSSDIIAVDLTTGVEYTASELVDKKLLIPYIENGLDVIFYGQYNENNRWDGECLLNVYSGDTLIAINESVYDDGELLSYKQIMSDTVSDTDAWIVSERNVVDSSNSVRNGNSWNYRKIDNYCKSFDCQDVEVGDLLYVNTFKGIINGELLSFYHGNTSDGYYNDDTGEAYLVTYGENGTICTLYQGKFTDGKFEDNTGSAWYITNNGADHYMYYKGNYSNGITTNNDGHIFENELTIDRINEIVNESGIDFKCELKWDGEPE